MYCAKQVIFFLALLAMICLATGCQTYWYQPSTTLEKAVQDCRECWYDAERATIGIDSAVASGMRSGFLFNECMKSRGYMQVVPDRLPSGVRTTTVQPNWANSIGVAGD